MKVINQALIVALEGCFKRNERKRARISSRWSRARISRRDFPLKLVFALIKINLLIAIKINNKFRVWIQMRTLSQYFFVFSRFFFFWIFTLVRSREALGYAFSMNIHWVYLPTLRWDSGCLQESVKWKMIKVIEPKSAFLSVFSIRWICRRSIFFKKLSIYSIISSPNWLTYSVFNYSFSANF